MLKNLYLSLCLLALFGCSTVVKERDPASDQVTQTDSNQIDVIKIGADTSFAQFIKKIQFLPERSRFVLVGDQLIINKNLDQPTSYKNLQQDKVAATAGHISFVFDDEGLSEVKIDNEAGELCPEFESLEKASVFLAENFYLQGIIKLVNRPNTDQCQ